MKIYSLPVFSVLILTLFLGCGQDQNKNFTGGTIKAPMIQGKDINGKGDISLKQFAGKAVLVNFWATWCPPCRQEIPDLIKLQDAYKGKLIVIGMSVDRNGPDEVREYSQKNKINYPVIMTDNAIIHNYGGIAAIPTTFLIDAGGNIAKKFIGSLSYDQYEAEIKPFLSK